ncbi:MAG TPA: alpha/beta fold hydrolase [Bdellovibrionota bacterium]|jgi:pimeloyl-ACP methyl ester carboxylesterase|nr:alpha/beta fold hydrolase [Bdellovibrionota bacterium]
MEKVPLQVSAQDTLMMHRFKPATGASGGGAPVILLHGAIENARIFFSSNGKGLAPYLAAEGYDVFVVDLRGRGASMPPIGRGSAHGQNETIVVDIPAVSDEVARLTGDKPQIWGSHSWGGVTMLAALARHPRLRPRVARMVFFSTKRCIHQFNSEVFWKIRFFWHGLAFLMVRLFGYLPAKRMGMGSDDETRLSHWESTRWVRPGPWVDPRDGFDYGAALDAWPADEKPPMLFLTGAADRCLGHPADVKALIQEAGPSQFGFEVLGRFNGNAVDYDHVSILTHPEAPKDVFAELVRWLRGSPNGAAS